MSRHQAPSCSGHGQKWTELSFILFSNTRGKIQLISGMTQQFPLATKQEQDSTVYDSKAEKFKCYSINFPDKIYVLPQEKRWHVFPIKNKEN